MIKFESPVLRDFIAQWQSLCPPGGIPTTEDYLDQMSPKVAPHLMMFEVLEDDMLVRFQGTVIAERRSLQVKLGASWFQFNPHLNARNVLSDTKLAVTQPCGIWTLAHFVTNSQRGLRVEALSLPLAVKAGRPARLINASAGLSAMDFDERAMGWQGSIDISWIDLGFGVPKSTPLPVS